MEVLNALFQGFNVILTPINMLLMFVGIILGLLIGVLPGLGGGNGTAVIGWRNGVAKCGGDFAAADLREAADVGDYYAAVHLMGRIIRRHHRLDLAQHPR